MSDTNTIRVLSAMGAEYVRIVGRELGVRRTVRSKTTGKKYQKKVTNSGKLKNSFGFDVGEEGDEIVLNITAADYADEVNDGTPRAASKKSLERWIRTKPYRFRAKNGRFLPTTATSVANFAGFLSWKISHIGSDRTGYLDGIGEKVENDFSQLLADAVTDDIAETLADALDNLPNTEAQTD